MHEVNKKMARGAAWMVSFKFLERGLGLISTIILARLLIPEDFGVVAMAISLIAVSELLGAFSFDLVLIQRKGADHSHYNTAWTLNVILACAATIVIVAMAGPVADFYREPRLVPVIYLLAIGSLVEGFENIGVVEFRKQLQFDKEFRYRILKKIAGFSIAVPMAFLLRNYWALVFGTVFGRIVGVAFSYWAHAYRPALSLQRVRELMSFSAWTFINNLVDFAHQRSADFVLGRLAGAAPLGVFRVGYEFANLPTTELVAPINRAVFPGYAALSTNRDELQRSYLHVLGLIALFAVPAGLGIAALAEQITLLLLGPNWIAAIPIIQIVAFYGITHALQANLYSVYLAIGRPSLRTITSSISMALCLTLTIILAKKNGAIGAAAAYLIAELITAPLNFLIVSRTLKLNVMRIFRVQFRPVLSGLLMFLILRSLVNLLPELVSIPQLLASVFILVVIGMSSYFLILAVLWNLAGKPPGAEELALNSAREYFSKR